MDTTNNFGLKKPGTEDFVDIDVINENADIIDARLAGIPWFGTCPTPYSTAIKVVTTSTGDFKLKAGSRIAVKFTNYNTTSSPYLNVDGTGAKYIKQYGTTAPGAYTWYSGEVVEFVYDGTYFIIIDGATADTSRYGPTKLSDSTSSTSTTLAATANAVKKAYDRGTAGIDAADEAYGRADEAYALAEEIQELVETVDAKGSHVVYITTSQTWTVPAGVEKIDVFIVNGGYDGVSSSNNKSSYGAYGSGGKGGGMLYIPGIKVEPGQEFNVQIGAANGGKSSFGIFGGQVTETPGGSGLNAAVTPRRGNSGLLGKINNYFEGMPCPINGKYYGVSGAAGGSYIYSYGTESDLHCGAGGVAGKSNPEHCPQGGINATTDASSGYSVTYDGGGGGGASYDNPGGNGKALHVSSETPRFKSNIGGDGGDATSFGCGGGGCGQGGGSGGKGAPGGVIIGY